MPIVFHWILRLLVLAVCVAVVAFNACGTEPTRIVYDSQSLPGIYQDGSLRGYPQL